MKAAKKHFLLLLGFLLTGAACPLFATDDEAAAAYHEGYRLYADGKYYDAAKKFEDSYILADSSVIRANTLVARIAAFRVCGLLYREFQAIEQLLERHMEYADYKGMVAREYEIADWYNAGNREPLFWAFRWIPWLTTEDHTEEIYTKALARAPYAEQAPRALMKLAYWYEMQGMTQKVLETLQKLLNEHPEAPECKYALLALGNGFYEIGLKGDGDGQKMKNAISRFQEFQRRYPDATEVDFARRKLAVARDARAEKLMEMANFYRKSGRSEVASRYLTRVMREYPDSESAIEAEKELVELDKHYLPGDFSAGNRDPRLPYLPMYEIPKYAELELISPLAEGNHFLLPIPDLKGEILKKKNGEN